MQQTTELSFLQTSSKSVMLCGLTLPLGLFVRGQVYCDSGAQRREGTWNPGRKGLVCKLSISDADRRGGHVRACALDIVQGQGQSCRGDENSIAAAIICGAQQGRGGC